MGASTDNAILFPKSSTKSQGVVKRTASITIGATDGYTIKVSGNPNLTGKKNSANKIASTASGVTLTNMANNRWGWYSVDGDVDCSNTNVFKAMTTAGETVASGSLDTTMVKNLTMCFGAKVDTNQAADTYENTVILSAVAEPKSVATFDGITTMQQMTTSICSAAEVNDTAYLRDTRDNNYYWITKLLDGNCWMSQNLDLDITTSNITTAASDVTSNWTTNSTYKPVATVRESEINSTTLAYGTGNDTSTYSWDFGKFVISVPTSTTFCTANNTGLGACTEHFTAIGNRSASADPNFYRLTSYIGTDGVTSCTKNANTAASTTAYGVCAQYDAHYLVGNHYTWNTATAGTGGTITSANATGSICPKNWKLPSSGDNTTKSTFGYMLSRYGVNSHSTGTSSVNNNTYNIALSPLFFVRGGYIEPNDKYLYGAGNYSRYWSSVPRTTSTDQALSLLFSSNVSPSNPYETRNRGLSLRCLIPAA